MLRLSKAGCIIWETLFITDVVGAGLILFNTSTHIIYYILCSLLHVLCVMQLLILQVNYIYLPTVPFLGYHDIIILQN